MPNDSIDAKGTRVKALGTKGMRVCEPWAQGRKTSDVNACWGLGIVVTSILNTFFDHKRANEGIEALGMRGAR